MAWSQPLWWVLALFVLGALVVTWQRVGVPPENNFRIFRATFWHLMDGRDLYAVYPAEFADRFKYSPTFALLFAPFAALPAVPAYFAWQLVSILALFVGVTTLLARREAALALLIAFPSVVSDLQRAQSNTLCAGLMLLAWSGLERRRQLGAATAAALGAFVKIFPLAALAGALLHPRKLRQALVAAGAMTTGVLLPLLITTPTLLLMQYRSWLAIETDDALLPEAYGRDGAGLYAGLMGVLHVWFGLAWPHLPVQLFGLIVLLAPIALRRDQLRDVRFRTQLIASILVFCVLFNHQAESPTYVIAMVGMAIWFAAHDRAAWRTALIVVAVLLVNVGSSGILPSAVYLKVYVAYLLKTVPLILIWCVMQLELLGLLGNTDSEFGERDAADRADAQRTQNAG